MFGQAVEAVAVKDELVEEVPEGRTSAINCVTQRLEHWTGRCGDGASGSKPGDGPTGPAAGRVEAEVVGTPELPVHHTKATRAGLPQPSA